MFLKKNYKPLPARDYAPNESLKKFYLFNLYGIINSEPRFKAYKKGDMKQRVSLILPDLRQVVLDIFSTNKKYRPTFGNNWKDLQIICAFNATFMGTFNVNNKEVLYFQMGSSSKNQNNRGVWLSGKGEKFWKDPIRKKDANYIFQIEAKKCWPFPIPTPPGLIWGSEGSILLGDMSKIYTNFHTSFFEPWDFEEFVKLHRKIADGLKGVKNIYTGKLQYEKLNFVK